MARAAGADTGVSAMPPAPVLGMLAGTTGAAVRAANVAVVGWVAGNCAGVCATVAPATKEIITKPLGPVVALKVAVPLTADAAVLLAPLTSAIGGSGLVNCT